MMILRGRETEMTPYYPGLKPGATIKSLLWSFCKNNNYGNFSILQKFKSYVFSVAMWYKLKPLLKLRVLSVSVVKINAFPASRTSLCIPNDDSAREAWTRFSAIHGLSSRLLQSGHA
jgi:hypothetical protein